METSCFKKRRQVYEIAHYDNQEERRRHNPAKQIKELESRQSVGLLVLNLRSSIHRLVHLSLLIAAVSVSLASNEDFGFSR